MTTKRVSPRYTKLMTKALDRWLRKGQQAAQRGDIELCEQYAKDADELEAFLVALHHGDLEEAARLASEMDTLVRDQIPASVYRIVFPNR